MSNEPHTLRASTPATGTPAFLQVRGLRKEFGATLALDDVAMEFIPGKIHCILGENGAGKSTLGKIIGGVHTLDAGIIAIEGRAVTLGTVPRARRLGIAVVFQELSLAPDLTVRSNLLLGMEPHSHPFALLRRNWEKGCVLAVLNRLKIEADAEDRVRDLSIATQQLLEVAKVLIRHPKMIVLDEPTAMLNEVEKRNLYEVLKSLRAEGAALALITHHLEDVEAVADQVTIMRDGRVVDSFAASSAWHSSAIAEKLSGARAGHAPITSRATREAPFLRIDGLSDRAGNPAAIELRRGEIVGLYGVVGCGAEHVARVLAGVHQAADLQVTLDGRRIIIGTPVRAHRLGISYLPTGRASNGILPTRSIRENLNVSLLGRYSQAGFISRQRETAGTRAQLAASAVKYTDLDEDIVNLSGGNQQKVLVARVLCAGSRLLILEDPTAGIDIQAKQLIQGAIRARAAEGVAVVLVSSDLLETIELVETLVTMYGGRVVHQYTLPGQRDKTAIVADVIGHQDAATVDPPTTAGNNRSFARPGTR